MLRTSRGKSVQMWGLDKGYLQLVIQGISEISFIDHLSLIFFTWDRKAQYIEVRNMNHFATNPSRNYLIGLTGIYTNLVCLYSVQLLSCIQLFVTSWAITQSSRLLCPWDLPGKNTGVVCQKSRNIIHQYRQMTNGQKQYNESI